MNLPQQRERVTVDGLGNAGVGKYTETVEKSGKSGIIKSGALSGAHNPQSDQAQEHAEKYYEAVKLMKTDIKHISANTGFSEDDITKIKNHVFIEKHDLGNGELEYFYPNYEMAQSWQRLIDGKNIQKHDITLLNHELLEQRLMKKSWMNY